jgi:NADH-quinone oxidoreductase subunit K
MLSFIPNYFNSLSESFDLYYGLHLELSIFLIALFGIFYNRRNFLITLLCIELLLFAVIVSFIMFSIYLHLYFGVIYALLGLTIAAAETAMGLSLMVLFYRLTNKVSFDSLIILRG